jgi:transcriptional regulator with XRE-family HTH domain
MLNEALRLLRVFNDLKAVELAEKLSISTSYLSEIEKGKKEPSLDIIKKYAEIFDTSPSTILFFSENLDKEGSSFKKSIGRKLIQFLQNIENASV